MEKTLRKGSETQPSSNSQDPSSMSLDPFFDFPEEFTIPPPSDEVVVNLVDVYFRILQDSFFNFLHEGMFITRMQEQTIPKSLLYAVCAASSR
jgi:hypothetical protein